MNILQNLILALNKEECKNLKIYLNRTRIDVDKKNELLFDLIKKQTPENYDEEKIFSQIYSANDSKLTFNRLKSRLLQDISESLATFNFDASDIHFIVNNYLLYKTFINRNEFDLATYFIKRAEKKAEEIQHLELLDLVYGDIIKLSHEVIDINPELYVSKRKGNRVKLNNLNEMDDVLAIISNKVKLRSISNAESIKVYKQLEEVVNNFTSNKQFNNDRNFKIKIYEAISRILLNKKDYVSLEDYLLKTYRDFSAKKIFDKNSHSTKIQMLIYICNTFFVNEKYTESLKYSNDLKEALHEFDNLLYEKNLIYYYNVLNNNYSEINTPKAIFYLNAATNNKLIYKHSYYMAFVYYNLAGCYYDLKDYKQALKNIVKLYAHSSYGNIDNTIKLKINITELILRIELKDYDYAETKIKQIKKEYKRIIEENETDKEMLYIITQILINDSFKINALLKQRIQKLVTNYNDKDTTEVVNYATWLKNNYLK